MKTLAERAKQEFAKIQLMADKENQKAVKEIKKQIKDKKHIYFRIDYTDFNDLAQVYDDIYFKKEWDNYAGGGRKVLRIDGREVSAIYQSFPDTHFVLKEGSQYFYLPNGMQIPAMFVKILDKLPAKKLTENDRENISRMIEKIIKTRYDDNDSWVTEGSAKIMVRKMEKQLNSALLVKLKHKVVGKDIEILYEDQTLANKPCFDICKIEQREGKAMNVTYKKQIQTMVSMGNIRTINVSKDPIAKAIRAITKMAIVKVETEMLMKQQGEGKLCAE